jgi:hypothetical protein
LWIEGCRVVSAADPLVVNLSFLIILTINCNKVFEIESPNSRNISGTSIVRASANIP